MLRLFLVAFTLLCVSSTAYAWSAAGHEITAQIAQSLLSSRGLSYIAKVLGTASPDALQSVSTWADQIKQQPGYEWSPPLHYIDTPDNLCKYNYTRDCFDIETGLKGACVAGAITNYTNILLHSDPTKPSVYQTEALKFLVHFIGDIHQPLHVGFTTDRGGNTITGTFYGTDVNLHGVWDYNLISHRELISFDKSMDNYITFLEGQVNSGWSGNVTQWLSCGKGAMPCPDLWADESIFFACGYAYHNAAQNFQIEDAYYNAAFPVVDERLAAGGVRLAATIEAIAHAVSKKFNLGF